MTEPRWIEFARSKIGVWHDGPDVPQMAAEIAERFPEMTAYTRMATDSMAWCGCFVARCLAEAGIRPQYVADNDDENDAFWAQSWKQFGTGVDKPQVGDILVFARHVTFFVGEGSDQYRCLGGNQSDAVTIAWFAKSGCQAIRRPPAPGERAAESKPIPENANSGKADSAADEFHQYLPDLLESEGGNDDDPDDKGGRTSRGVTQSEYDVWRKTHPGLPADVWDAPDSTVEAIFKEKYWDVLQGDALPAGVDYVVFDYGVLSGVGLAAQILQGILGVDKDGEIGPITIAAAKAADHAFVINELSRIRLERYRRLSTWWKYGNGWSSRVERVRKRGLSMIGTDIPAPIPVPVPVPTPIPVPVPPKESPTMNDLDRVLSFIAKNYDDIKLLLTFLRLSPSVAPAALASLVAPTPAPAPSPPKADKAVVQASAAAVGASIVGMGAGAVGTPFGLGADPSLAGTLSVIIPAATALLGSVGGWGAVLGVLGNLARAAAPKGAA